MSWDREIVLNITTPTKKEEKWVKKLAREVEKTIWGYIRDYGNATAGDGFDWELKIKWNEKL